MKADKDKYLLAEKKIFVYGAGEMGKNVISTLLKEGFVTEGVIDKRGDAYKDFHGCKVITPEILLKMSEKDDIAIIFAFKNVYQHNEIALILKDNGFFNLIFKPLQILYGDYSSKELQEISDAHGILTDRHSMYKRSVPNVRNLDLKVIKKERAIYEDEEYVTATVPAELLYMNNNPDYREWIEQNIMASYPSVELYRGIGEAVKESLLRGVSEYRDKIAIPGAIRAETVMGERWESNLIEARESSYFEMKKQQALNPTFFLENCVEVRFTSPYRFRMVSSGKNRISFLIAEGYSYIPVKMLKTDYEKYLNEDVARQVAKYIQNMPCLLMPIRHPYFYHCSVVAKGYVEIWMMRVARYLVHYYYNIKCNFEFADIMIGDALFDYGITGRYLSMIGFRVERKYNDNLTCLLDSLYYMDSSDYLKNQENYEVVLVSNCQNTYKKVDGILSNNSQICIVQCWDKDEEFLQKIKEKGFQIRNTFFSIYWGERYVEGYIMTRR